jgi:hypothetical protein
MTAASDNAKKAEVNEAMTSGDMATSDGAGGGPAPHQEPSLADPAHPWRRAAQILGLGAIRAARSRTAEQRKARAGFDARTAKVEAGKRRGRQQAKRKARSVARKRETG